MNNDIICKICLCIDDPINSLKDLISPCNCKGSIQFVHKTCLRAWRLKQNYTNTRKCIQCGSQYNIEIIRSNTFIIMLSTLSVFVFTYLIVSSFINLILLIFKYTYIELLEYWIYTTQYFLTKYYNYSVILVYSIVIKEIMKPSLFNIFNFVFAFWRITRFEFAIDKLLFLFMVIYNHKISYEIVSKYIERRIYI